MKRRLFEMLRKGIERGEKVPRGLRTLLGVLLMAGGVFGILPILGFWMLPLGAAFIALDIPPLRQRLLRWLEERSPTVQSKT
ncbi:MAG: hypothetical protein FJX54_03975 [Alphaproteobacteria bacterium]|nr:hypothetical protein [Alphaproteobacteria bacterium]